MNWSAVLLCAGQGQRMGGVPKALLQVDGSTLLQRLLTALTQAGVPRPVVVTGEYHEQVEPLLQTQPVHWVRNRQPERGQASSVQLGLESLPADTDAALILLCDQPLVGSAEIRALMQAFEQRTQGECLVPFFRGQRGHPVVLSGPVVRHILSQSPRPSPRQWMDANPEQVLRLAVEHDHYVVDLDTPADLAAFARRSALAQVPER